MHQEHNIPWKVFPSNFKYVTEDRRSTPPYTGFISINRPTQANELNHFTRKMISTIQEFSKTARKKYPAPDDLRPPADGKLFSDQLRDKYPEFLDSNNQRLDYWINCVFHDPRHVYSSTYWRTINATSLADVIKILIHENQMETVLMLANHPLIPLYSLDSDLGRYYDYGFRGIAETALIPYIFWNFMAISDRLVDGAYKSQTYERVVQAVLEGLTGDSRHIPHWEFHGVKRTIKGEMPDVEPGRLHEYLKHLFCLLYRYDMVIAECKRDPEWEELITLCISSYYSIKPKRVMDAEGWWKYQF